MYQIYLGYSHMIHYIIIWHVVSIHVSLYIYIYGQAGCRRYSRVIRGAPGDAKWENLVLNFEAKSV